MLNRKFKQRDFEKIDHVLEFVKMNILEELKIKIIKHHADHYNNLLLLQRT